MDGDDDEYVINTITQNSQSSKRKRKSNKFPPCTVCSSTKYYRDDAGFYVCEYGHQLQSYQEEQGEFEGIEATGWRRGSARESNRNSTSKKPVVRKGTKKVKPDVFLEAVQFILKLQVKALIKIAHLPIEVETIIKDLWLMHITLLDIPDSVDETGLLDEAFVRTRAQADIKEHEEDLNMTRPNNRVDNTDDNSGFSSTMSMDAANESNNLKQTEESHTNKIVLNHYSENTSDENAGVSSKASSTGKKILKICMNALNLTPLHLLALMYLGCFALKLPIFPSDILKWCDNGSIPYWTAYDSMPLYLSTQLPNLSRHFRPLNLPNLTRFEETIHIFMNYLSRGYKDLEWPDLNRPLLLLRLIRELNLPLELYVMASRLWQLGHSVTLDCGIHRFRSVAAPLIVAIRLNYDLDDKSKESEIFVERLMNEVEDAKLTWNWSQEDLDARFHHLRKQYLEWAKRQKFTNPLVTLRQYGRLLVSEISSASQLLEASPTNFSTTRRPLRSALLPNADSTDSTSPYRKYIVYNSYDRLGNIPKSLSTLIRRITIIVGGDEEALLRVVKIYESALNKDQEWLKEVLS